MPKVRYSNKAAENLSFLIAYMMRLQVFFRESKPMMMLWSSGSNGRLSLPYTVDHDEYRR